ncbi:MAG: hypothetical protein ABIH75_02230 [Candidatus Omnitrophota bacterium]
MGSISRDSRTGIPQLIIFLSISLFAFFLTFKAGERGFFAFDQSIVFDGGYRILSGQVPYKDFVMPVGPVTFWIQAIFFKILGVSYFSYIFTAAFINTLSVISAIIIIRLLFPSQRLLSYAAGLLTATWFSPPFGTLWVEQASFFFSFLAIAALLFTQLSRGNYPVINGLLLLLSGSFAWLSILCKQNAGLYILPLYFLLLIAARMPDLKSALYGSFIFSAGFIVSLLLFVFWLWMKSDLKIFLQYFIYIPSLLGIDRILEGKADLFKIFIGGISQYKDLYQLPAGIRFIFISAFVTAVFTFITCIRNHKRTGYSVKRELLASILCVYVIFFQYLFIHTTMNQAENGIPFIGIIFVVGIALLLHLYNYGLFKLRFAYHKIIPVIALSLLVIYPLLLGIKVSLTRKVHGFTSSTFPGYFALDKLKALKWALPTRTGEAEVKEDDIVNLFEYLKAKNDNFFIFPNFTFFYGLLNVPSPQPILWFHKGLTYHVLYDQTLDKWVVDDLKKNMVNVIIIEDEPPYNHYVLNNFPQLKSYISGNFIKTRQLGIFNIYEKTAPRVL